MHGTLYFMFIFETNVSWKNIDFQTTILSRFDMIFIVKDEHNEARDRVSLFLLVHPFVAHEPFVDHCEIRYECPHESSQR